MSLPTQTMPSVCEQCFVFARVQTQAKLAGVRFILHRTNLNYHTEWNIYSTAGMLLHTGNVSQRGGKGFSTPASSWSSP